jgi:iron complex outermembrane receptor protein
MPSLVMPDAIIVTKNLGKLHSSGIELEASLQASKAISIQYNAGITSALFDNFNYASNGTELNVKDKHQIFTPDATSFLAFHLNQPISNKIHFLLNTDWKYTGTTYFDIANNIKQSPYNTLNGSLGIQYQKMQVLFWTRNITDVHYINYAYDFGAVHLAEPKRLGITASIQL